MLFGRTGRNLGTFCLPAGHPPSEMSDSEDDGVPQLSSHTLAALREFYAEQQQQHADPRGEDRYSIGVIEEDWVRACAGLSQLGPTPVSLACRSQWPVGAETAAVRVLRGICAGSAVQRRALSRWGSGSS